MTKENIDKNQMLVSTTLQAEPVNNHNLQPVDLIGQPIIEQQGALSTEFYVDHLYADLKAILENKQITGLTLATSLISMMRIAERFPSLKGSEKKELLLRVYNKYMEEHSSTENSILPPEYREMLNALSGMMDTFVAIDKKEIKITLDKETCCFCFASLEKSLFHPK